MEKRLVIRNVIRATYGNSNKYNENPYPLDLEKKLRPYVEKGYLKTDFKSLTEVAKIIEGWYGEMVVVSYDGTIIFYNGDY